MNEEVRFRRTVKEVIIDAWDNANVAGHATYVAAFIGAALLIHWVFG